VAWLRVVWLEGTNVVSIFMVRKYSVFFLFNYFILGVFGRVM